MVDCGDGVGALDLKLQMRPLQLIVYNIYRSWRYQVEAGELPSLASRTSLVVMGNFNAHRLLLKSVSLANTTD